MRPNAVFLLVLVALLAACTQTVRVPESTPNLRTTAMTYVPEDLGTLGGDEAEVQAVSADGSVIVGRAQTASGARRAARWTAAGGIQDLGSFGFYPLSSAVSADGSVVVGYRYNTSSYANHAVRWTAAGGVEDLGTLGGRDSIATAVSADGSVVVGSAALDRTTGHAFRWTAAGGMEGLGTLPGDESSQATSVSSDGSVIVGFSSGSDGRRAFRWTASGGMQNLGTVEGYQVSGYYGDYVVKVSADGSTVIGNGCCDKSKTNASAFRWTAAGGREDLETLPGDTFSQATALSADGSVVVGQSYLERGDENYTYYEARAFRWSASGGIKDLGALGRDEIQFTGEVTDVSADGSVVIGNSGGYGLGEAFVWTAAAGRQALPILGEAGSSGAPRAVSADGSVIVGQFYDASSNRYYAGRWTLQTVSDDGDGIASSIDGSFVGGSFTDESGAFSNSFTDQHLSGTSFGEIIDRGGLELSLADSTIADEGVNISAQGGSGTAKVKPCGLAFTMSLTDGDSVTANCGSLTTKVVSGEVDVTLSNGAVVTVSQPGATAHISEQENGNFLVKNLTSSGSVVIRIGELTKVVKPGETAEAALYDFSGFFQPVDNLPAVNRAKAGSSIPVKFSLGGDQGLGVIASGYPKAQTYTCQTGTLTDAIEQTVTAGSSSLSYDAASGRYTYVWKTDKSWTGCRQLIFKFKDGQEQRANFQFTK